MATGSRVAVGGFVCDVGGGMAIIGPDNISGPSTRILGNAAVEFIPAGVPPPGIPPVLMVIRQR